VYLKVLGGSFVFANILSQVYRFPVPFGGYIGPFGVDGAGSGFFNDLVSTSIAWLMYGLLGGFVVIGLLCFIVFWMNKKFNIERRMSLVLYVLIAILPTFLLSILDYIIGDW
jgi:hypothetical protein